MDTLVDPEQLVGFKEAVEITGTSRRRFQVLMSEGRAPELVVLLACGPIWTPRRSRTG